MIVRLVEENRVPKKGMQGGFASLNVSRYSPKFLVLIISFLIWSRMTIVLLLTWLQVLLRRWIGAVPRAEMIEVRVEKLLSERHFCNNVSNLEVSSEE
jgi:hypothetical protein